MMRNVMARLWNDDDGALIAVEWIFLATILILGVIVGMVAVRQAIIAEFHDIANSLLALNQSFRITGQSNCESSTAGTFFFDLGDSIVVRSTVATPGGFDNRACD